MTLTLNLPPELEQYLVVVLDAGPIGPITNPKLSAQGIACNSEFLIEANTTITLHISKKSYDQQT